jgi:hypothetical protein
MASRVASNLGSRIPWQCCRHHTQAHCRGPARQGTARPAANLQFWYGVRRAARHRHTDGKSSYSLSSAPNRINIEQGG